MAEIVIDDLTTRTLEGTGVFDSLMTANRIRLDREFDKTRIKGPDYSKVYLGGMEAAMQQSIIYLLGRQKADKEAELIEEQILKTIAEVLLIGDQREKLDAETELLIDQLLTEALNRDKTDAEINLLIDQLISEALNRDKTTAEINLLVDQLLTESKKREQMDSEIALTDQKTLTEVENTELVTQNTALALANTELTDKKTLTEVENAKLVTQNTAKSLAETNLLDKKALTEIQNTLLVTAKTATEGAQKDLLVDQLLTEALKRDLMAEQILIAKKELEIKTQQVLIETEKLKLTEAQTWAEKAKTTSNAGEITAPADISTSGGMFGEQIKKTAAEVALLTQKEATELAQTDAAGLDADSILGKQAALYQKQADGFTRDAEQKLAKIFSDTLNTQIVSREDTETGSAGMAYEDICAVLNKARAGISAGSSSSCAVPGQTVVINAHT